MAATTITRMQVRRPDGTIETVEKEGSLGNSPQFRKQATEATRKAGRGEIISFEVVANPACEIVLSEIEQLRDERRDLVATVRGLIEESDDAFERAHARENVLAWEIKRRADAKVEAARDALTAFDAAHPEVIAQIRTEKQEAAERFLRQD